MDFCWSKRSACAALGRAQAERSGYSGQLAVSASVSGGYGAFSASASASYESLKNEVTSSTNYGETEQEDKTVFEADQLQIIRDIQTTVTINGKSASVSERDFITTVPVEESLSSSKLNRMADVYMADEFGEKAVSNTFHETICQEKKKVNKTYLYGLWSRHKVTVTTYFANWSERVACASGAN